MSIEFKVRQVHVDTWGKQWGQEWKDFAAYRLREKAVQCTLKFEWQEAWHGGDSYFGDLLGKRYGKLRVGSVKQVFKTRTNGDVVFDSVAMTVTFVDTEVVFDCSGRYFGVDNGYKLECVNRKYELWEREGVAKMTPREVFILKLWGVGGLEDTSITALLESKFDEVINVLSEKGIRFTL